MDNYFDGPSYYGKCCECKKEIGPLVAYQIVYKGTLLEPLCKLCYQWYQRLKEKENA